eukprot:gene58145-biopygen63700
MHCNVRRTSLLTNYCFNACPLVAPDTCPRAPSNCISGLVSDVISIADANRTPAADAIAAGSVGTPSNRPHDRTHNSWYGTSYESARDQCPNESPCNQCPNKDADDKRTDECRRSIQSADHGGSSEAVESSINSAPHDRTHHDRRAADERFCSGWPEKNVGRIPTVWAPPPPPSWALTDVPLPAEFAQLTAAHAELYR